MIDIEKYCESRATNKIIWRVGLRGTSFSAERQPRGLESNVKFRAALKSSAKFDKILESWGDTCHNAPYLATPVPWRQSLN